MLFNVLASLIGGLNFDMDQLRNNPASWVKMYGIRVLVALFLMTGYTYTFLPKKVGPFKGYGTPLVLLWTIQCGLSSIGVKREDDESSSALSGAFVLGTIFIGSSLSFVGSPVFNTKVYQQALGEVGEIDITSESEILNFGYVRGMSKATANEAADNQMGSDEASIFEISHKHATVQMIHDRQVWLYPTDYSGFFKWTKNRNQGAPGYKLLDASKPTSGPESVSEYPLLYTPGAYFGYDLERHIYMSGFDNYLYEDITLEANDEGKPYWVVTLLEPKLLYGLKTPVGVVTVEPETGDITFFEVGKTPDFIERVIPDNIALDRVNDKYSLANGYFRFGNDKGLFRATASSADEMYMVFNKAGEAFWWTGLTSLGSDESIVGFARVNTVTGKGTEYRFKDSNGRTISVRNEKKTVNLMNTLYSNQKEWNADLPLMYTLNGELVWISPVVNANSIGVGYAIAHPTLKVGGFGKDIRAALRDYNSTLRRDPASRINAEDDYLIPVRLRVKRVEKWSQDGNTVVSIVTEESDTVFEGRPFEFPSEQASELVLTREGDVIRINKADTQEGLPVVPITHFDNEAIGVVEKK